METYTRNRSNNIKPVKKQVLQLFFFFKKVLPKKRRRSSCKYDCDVKHHAWNQILLCAYAFKWFFEVSSYWIQQSNYNWAYVYTERQFEFINSFCGNGINTQCWLYYAYVILSCFIFSSYTSVFQNLVLRHENACSREKMFMYRQAYLYVASLSIFSFFSSFLQRFDNDFCVCSVCSFNIHANMHISLMCKNV